MKKILLVVVLLCVVLYAFANQLTYSADSPQWKVLTALYRMEGKTYPGVVTPISDSSLRWLYKELGVKSEALDGLLDVSFEYRDRDFAVNAGAEVSYAGLYVSNANRDRHELFYPIQDIPALMKADAAFVLSEKLGAEIVLDLIRTPEDYEMGSYGHNFSPHLSDSDFDFFRPHKAYVGFGSENLGILVARDRLSASNGFTGNLTIGDNFFYQDFIKLSALYPVFSYDMTMASFCANQGTLQDPQFNLAFPSWDEAHPTVINHRLTLNLGSVAFTFLEGVMNFTDNALGDPRILNPFNILHNQFTFRNLRINNFFALELDWAIAKGYALHAQGFFDQIQLPFEGSDFTPNSFALLLNGSYTFQRNSTIFTLFAEGVYTSPSCYLKDTKTTDDGQVINHAITDLLIGNKATGFEDMGFMGYRYGCDVIVGSLGFRAIKANVVEYGAGFMYMAHGEKRIDYKNKRIPDAPVLGRDEKKFIFTPYLFSPNAKVEHNFILSADIDYRINSMFRVASNYCLLGIINYQNQANNNIFEAQIGFSFTIEFLN